MECPKCRMFANGKFCWKCAVLVSAKKCECGSTFSRIDKYCPSCGIKVKGGVNAKD